MAEGKVFRLKQDTHCADCGRLLKAGEKVRGYRNPTTGRWKIYCLKGHGNGKDEPPPDYSPSPRQQADRPPAGSLQEVLDGLKQVEAKLDRILSLLEGKEGDGQ